jgi:pilus assembly protein CpaB
VVLPKKFLPLIIAVGLGLIALVLFNVYVRQQTEVAKQKVISAQKNFVSVVVAKMDIPAGVGITENMLSEQSVSKDRLQPRAATDVDRVVGKVTIAPISKGEQILLNKVTLSGREVSLSSKVPRGKRAITIPVDNISSVGGMIKPGDHVDVMGMVPIPAMTPEGKQATQMTTMPLFQDVLVLAVGQEFTVIPGSDKKERALSPVITLALSPQEANLVAFAQEQGKIRLILRSPEDTQTQPPVPATWETLLRTVMPQAFIEQPKEKEKAQKEIVLPPKKKIEVYHGTQKELKELD